MLFCHGSNGKPTESIGRDGKQNIPGTPERNWSSRRPNHNFVDVYIDGILEARRRIRLRQGIDKTVDSFSDFDFSAFGDAKAVLADWEKNLKWTQKGTGTDRCQPLPAPTCQSGLYDTKDASLPRVEPPSVSVELTEALSKGLSKVNGDLLTAIYERYLLDVVGEKGNLRVALFVHARDRYYEKLDKLIVGGMVTAEEIISDFSAHVLQKIEEGKYRDNDGKLAGWVAVCWSNYSSKYKKDFFREASLFSGVETFEIYNRFGNRVKDEAGYVPLRVVERQQSKRDAKTYHADNDPNSAKKRVERIVRDLDDPSTEFGKLDADTKQIIRELKDGKSIDAVSKSVGLCTRQVSRKLKQLRSMKGQSFLRVSSNYLLDTDDVVKGGVLYTVQTADFEREVGQ